MAFREWLSGISLAKWLVEVTAMLAILVLGYFVAIIGIDQVRHWTDEAYAEDQRVKRDFLCFQQRGFPPSPESASRLLQLQFEVETLMDSARQQLAPTDFVGKMQKLGLCAEFSAIKAGGLQFADPAKSLQDRQRLGAFDRGDDNPVQRRLIELEVLARVLPGFPADIQDQATQKLREMLTLYETSVVVLDAPLVIGDDDAPPPATDPVGPLSDPWLLIVGGDQSDAAAADQVRQTNEIVAAVGADLTVPPAEIYLVRSWRRTVIAFPDKTTAQEALNALKDRLPYGGYLRSQAEWCPDLAPHETILSVPATLCAI